MLFSGEHGIIRPFAYKFILVRYFNMQKMIDWTWGDINNGDVGPGMFSWFHFLWLGIMVIACVVMGLTVARKHSVKADRITISVFSVILIGCEVFKQLFLFYVIEGGAVSWGEFPFQMCSMPMYLCPLAVFTKNERLRRACYGFMMCFNLIGGLAGAFEPSGIFLDQIPLTVHAILWHYSLVYNSSYMLPNAILTGFFAFVLCAAVDPKFLRPMKRNI